MPFCQPGRACFAATALYRRWYILDRLHGRALDNARCPGSQRCRVPPKEHALQRLHAVRGAHKPVYEKLQVLQHCSCC